MTLTIRYKKQFKKDFKRVSSNPKLKKGILILMDLLNEHLIKTGTVPDEYLPHPLIGEWKPHMECHILPDLLLIWDVYKVTNEVILALI
jgi:mRNA interferase YafQ